MAVISPKSLIINVLFNCNWLHCCWKVDPCRFFYYDSLQNRTKMSAVSVLVAVMMLFHCAFAIKCYMCRSKTNHACEDPFNNSTIRTVHCRGNACIKAKVKAKGTRSRVNSVNSTLLKIKYHQIWLMELSVFNLLLWTQLKQSVSLNVYWMRLPTKPINRHDFGTKEIPHSVSPRINKKTITTSKRIEV